MQEPTANQQPSVDDFLSDINGTAKSSADTVITESGEKEIKETVNSFQPEKKMTIEEATTKVKQFMRMRDMLQSRGLAFAAGKPQVWDQFKMEQWEFDWYCEVYAEIVQDLGYIPKWLEILIVEAVVMGPKVKKVLDIRKETLALEKARQAYTPTHAENTAMQTDQPMRADYQKRWQVDENGYFTHTSTGQYLKSKNRTERPTITPANYAMLIKHNDQSFIDKIFGTK